MGPVEPVEGAPDHHVAVGLHLLRPLLLGLLQLLLLLLLHPGQLRVQQHRGQTGAAGVAVARVPLQTLRHLMGLARVLEGEVREHHLGGVRQRLWRGKGAVWNGEAPSAAAAAATRMSANVGEQNADVQVAADVGRVAVEPRN